MMQSILFLVLCLMSTNSYAAFVSSCSQMITTRLNTDDRDSVLCEQSTRSSQDFRGGSQTDLYTVNKDGFGGVSDWSYIGGMDGKTSGNSGVAWMTALPKEFNYVLLLFKGPSSHGIIGLSLPREALTMSWSWSSPFSKSGKKEQFQDVSHISLYARVASNEIDPGSPISDVSTPFMAFGCLLLFLFSRRQSQGW